MDIRESYAAFIREGPFGRRRWTMIFMKYDLEKFQKELDVHNRPNRYQSKSSRWSHSDSILMEFYDGQRRDIFQDNAEISQSQNPIEGDSQSRNPEYVPLDFPERTFVGKKKNPLFEKILFCLMCLRVGAGSIIDSKPKFQLVEIPENRNTLRDYIFES